MCFLLSFFLGGFPGSSSIQSSLPSDLFGKQDTSSRYFFFDRNSHKNSRLTDPGHPMRRFIALFARNSQFCKPRRDMFRGLGFVSTSTFAGKILEPRPSAGRTRMRTDTCGRYLRLTWLKKCGLLDL